MRNVRGVAGRLPIDSYVLLLVGTVVLAACIPARGESRAVVDAMVRIAVAGLFFLYGARLSPTAVWTGVTHWRLQLVSFAGTFLLFPLIGLLIGSTMRPYVPHDILVGLVYLCLLPSTVQSSIAFTSIARGNVPAALCSASLSNLAGVILTPVLVSLFLPAAGSSVSLRAVLDIATQIMLPFLAGQVSRPLISNWLLRHPILTSVVDRGSVLLVVYCAFSAGMVAGIWSELSVGDLALVLAIDLALLAFVVTTLTVSTRRLGFTAADQIAIVFCGSKKSMAGGIPMATILFPGHAVGLIVLPLMMFHQAQLFVCAALARHYASRSREGRPSGSTKPEGCSPVSVTLETQAAWQS